ncbi:Sulfoxide reductase heme-binding subunit YedZ [Roseivivax sp. THAF40]|uniref:protein-methionine-sulfoxide reductase heme-binding subunit MsrQ n=1 Tax=unclassified Roseivivax TaxID=2639302 RepID=UPI0012679751|nr:MULTISPECIES: protein-methionine-sulfoxide reductase heme-binding subunit MsrQ [unclassified Roseivivax]QFS81296.1 Sulfoxide reductase heme-binding subunit YedZ [Roseivivax sp. THAF197b]QFT45025.1 Sulfoxide reductase heme-binding subunit YedZ [Roseivivax sp. THAF40]
MTLVDRLNGWARRLPVWLVYLLAALPAPYLFYMGLTGGLGVEPIEVLEHEYGEIALQLLILGLCITPLRRHLGLNLIRFRRAIGLLAFYYLSLHLLVWLVLDVQILSQIWADILKRPYITVGMAGFLLLVPLALTSNNWSVRKLGTRWRQLHKLTYAAALLGGLHFVMLRKGFQLEPLIYLGVIALLLILRLDWRAIPRLNRA